MQQLSKHGMGGRLVCRPRAWLTACAATAVAIAATAASASAQPLRVANNGSPPGSRSITATVPESSSGSTGFHTMSAASGLVKVFDATLGRERAVPAAEAAKIIMTYWTPSRRATAIPLSVTAAPAAAGERSPDTGGVAQKVATPMPRQNDRMQARAKVHFSNAEGKIFFLDPRDRKGYQCSGGTVGSGKRRLVLTAGHCVHSGPGGQFMLNWEFQPGYQRGTGTPGVFPATELWAQRGWSSRGDRHYDYGIGITSDNDAGRRVVDAVGGNGLIINPGRPFVTAIGYPSNFRKGETQSYCQVTLRRRSSSNPDQELNCNRGAGASGEPWLKDYNNSDQLGDIVSDNSYSLKADHGPPEYGPYYDSDTRALYQAAENASP